MNNMPTRLMTAWTGRWLWAMVIAFALMDTARADAPWPRNTAVKLLVGYAPGGAADNLARVLAEAMSRRLSRPVVVENVVGAHGAQAAQKVLAAEPDGHTLLFGSTSDMVVAPLSSPQAGYQPGDFTAIAKISSSPMALVARPRLPGRTLDEVIALARRRPGQMTMGTTYERSLQSVAASEFMRAAGVEMALVPYRSSAAVLDDLMVGQIDVAVLTLSGFLRHARAGKVRVLGLMASSRAATAPEFPVLAESNPTGGLSMVAWVGIAGPPKLPQSVVARINSVIADVLSDPEFSAARLAAGDLLERPAPSAAFAKFIESEALFYGGKRLRHRP